MKRLNLTLVTSIVGVFVSAGAMAQDNSPRLSGPRRNHGVVWLEDFGAVPVKGPDRKNEAHAGNNVAAFRKALAALQKVYVADQPQGPYRPTKQNHIIGASPSVYDKFHRSAEDELITETIVWTQGQRALWVE